MRVFLLICISFFGVIFGCMAQATLPIVDPFDKHKPTIANPGFATTPQIFNNPTSIHSPANNKVQEQNTALLRDFVSQQKKSETKRDVEMLIARGFPMQSHNAGTEHYYKAFEEIVGMLNNDKPISLSRAIFLVENAYYNNIYNYDDYRAGIEEALNICDQKIQEEQLDKDDNVAKNMMIFRFISDTLTWKDKNSGRNIYHYPIKYNYEDYDSQTNYDSHFVTKLMQTGKGQCYSMPLYYLVLAEAMQAEAYWAFSPHHSFVKIQDKENVWYNLELTCKAILSDAHYMNNSYIKAEAIQNRIYLEPMDKINVVAHMLIELAKGYYQKYGLDDFYLKCADVAMQYLDNDLEALMLKSAYQTRLTLLLAHLLKAKNPEIMKEVSPDAYIHYEKMQLLYSQMDNLGYEELPKDLYARWLDYIAKEKAQSEKLPSIFINTPKEK